MNINLSLAPLVALVAGILILVMPRLLNFIVAIYLIIIGLIGLFGAGRLHLAQAGPQFVVSSQCFHNNAVTRRTFGMSRTGVVFFEDRMMNDGGCHCIDPYIEPFKFLPKTYDNKTTGPHSSHEPWNLRRFACAE